MTGMKLCVYGGTCDCVQLIFIWLHDRTVAVCLLKVRVTVVMYYYYDKLTGL